jgi:hypothetical protein
MPMLKNGQRVGETRAAGLTPAEPFYALVASPPIIPQNLRQNLPEATG